MANRRTYGRRSATCSGITLQTNHVDLNAFLVVCFWWRRSEKDVAGPGVHPAPACHGPEGLDRSPMVPA